jgi:lysophospholipid acyltransferase (LPLAT)-like uncharacterized protein
VRTGWKYTAAQVAGGGVMDALMGTVRMKVHNAAAWQRAMERGPVIFIPWHGRLLPLAYLHRGQGIHSLASLSADGEYITRLMRHWGFGMVRGSSSRGGDVAYRELIRTIRAGNSVAVTPDGPRGPREKMKLGMIQLAQLTGAPLIPVAAAASRAWWFVSWDRFLVPQPFSQVYVAYDEPIHVPRDADPSEAASAAEAVMARLMAHVEEEATR